MVQLTIREASPEDADVLAAIQERASVAALAHIFPPDRFPFPVEAVRDPWRTFEGRVVIATSGERAVGLVGIVPPWVEGLYVVPEAWGTGVAGALHDEAIDSLGRAGCGEGRLWVLEHNGRARRFYESRGWRPDGTTRVVPFPPHPIDVGYSISLADALPVSRSTS